MGLLVTAAVATYVAGRAKSRAEAATTRRSSAAAPYRIDWDNERVVLGDSESEGLDDAGWDEGAEFIESAKSLIGLLQKHPVAGGESCIAEMSRLVQRLQVIAGCTDDVSRSQRASLEAKVEAAWARTKDDCLRLRRA